MSGDPDLGDRDGLIRVARRAYEERRWGDALAGYHVAGGFPVLDLDDIEMLDDDDASIFGAIDQSVSRYGQP